MTDERLNFWAEVYARKQVREWLGITFAQFLTSPDRYTRCANSAIAEAYDIKLAEGEGADLEARVIATGFRPLLPAQQAIADRIEADGKSGAPAPRAKKPRKSKKRPRARSPKSSRVSPEREAA